MFDKYTLEQMILLWDQGIWLLRVQILSRAHCILYTVKRYILLSVFKRKAINTTLYSMRQDDSIDYSTRINDEKLLSEHLTVL